MDCSGGGNLVTEDNVPVDDKVATENQPAAASNKNASLCAFTKAVCRTRAYYVTDGGANENLGLVSALYALRGGLYELRRRGGVVPRPAANRARQIERNPLKRYFFMQHDTPKKLMFIDRSTVNKTLKARSWGLPIAPRP